MSSRVVVAGVEGSCAWGRRAGVPGVEWRCAATPRAPSCKGVNFQHPDAQQTRNAKEQVINTCSLLLARWQLLGPWHLAFGTFAPVGRCGSSRRGYALGAREDVVFARPQPPMDATYTTAGSRS